MWQLLRWRENCGFYLEKKVRNERIDILMIFGILILREFVLDAIV